MLEYFPCFHGYRKRLERLTDDEVGKLFRALMVYSEEGTVTDLPDRVQMAFDFISVDIDRNKQTYLEKSEKNRANVMRRYESNTTEYDRTQSKTTDFVPYQNKKENKNKVLPVGNTIKEKSIKEKSPTKSVFTPPTVEEVADYCKQRKNNVDPELFVAYYAKQGWKLTNGQTMKDWKSAVITWEKRDKERKPKQTTQTEPKKNGFLAMLEKWDEEHEGMF